MTSAKSGQLRRKFRRKLSVLAALGYCLLAVITLLAEYLSESAKLSRGMYTDTFNPLVFAEVATWPTSRFLVSWNGYPQQFSQPEWQKALNDSLPSHIWAIVVQTLVVFFLLEALSRTLAQHDRRRAATALHRKGARS